MKLSVVIPVYNEEKVIGACLDAITHQTEPADEIILVDNNCKDRTLEIAQKYPVKIVKETTQGISYARNRGFNTAKYEILGRIDADTVVGPDWVKTVKADFVDPNVVAITGPGRFRGLRLDWITERMHTIVFYYLLGLIHRHYLTWGSNMALRRDAWEKIEPHVNMNNKEVHEDLDLSFHLRKIGQIKLDMSLMVDVSNRRLLNIPSGMEYIFRYLKMLFRLFTGTYYQKA